MQRKCTRQAYNHYHITHADVETRFKRELHIYSVLLVDLSVTLIIFGHRILYSMGSSFGAENRSLQRHDLIISSRSTIGWCTLHSQFTSSKLCSFTNSIVHVPWRMLLLQHPVLLLVVFQTLYAGKGEGNAYLPDTTTIVARINAESGEKQQLCDRYYSLYINLL